MIQIENANQTIMEPPAIKDDSSTVWRSGTRSFGAQPLQAALDETAQDMV
jgi:hypothetical protein